jgi:general secretion pathway protein I
MSAKHVAGFTLLEVLVALTIAALALVGLFRAGGDGLFAVDVASRTEEALERAQSHLAALGRDVALLQGDSEGVDGGGYRWSLRVMSVASWPVVATIGAPRSPAILFDVEVAISWPAHGPARSVILKTRRVATIAQ